jgi:hypothetical protein
MTAPFTGNQRLARYPNRQSSTQETEPDHPSVQIDATNEKRKQTPSREVHIRTDMIPSRGSRGLGVTAACRYCQRLFKRGRLKHAEVPLCAPSGAELVNVRGARFALGP